MTQEENLNNIITKLGSEKKHARKIVSFREFFQGWGLFVVFVLICILFSILTPIFLRASNLINVVRQVSIIGTAAVGMAVLMITGGIDLSAGSHLAFIGLVIAILLKKLNLPILPAMVLALSVSAVIGVINAFLVTRVKMPPLIATLGMMSVLRGTGYVISGGYPIYDFPDGFMAIGKGYIGPFPIPALIMLSLFVLGYILLNNTYLGRYFYALGGNEEATRLCGVNVVSNRYIAYIISAVLTGLAGLILLARINSAQPSAGIGFEMDVITAVVLGGVSISGGEGKLSNVFLGVLIIGVISNGLTLLNVHDYYQTIIKGATLLLAVAIDKFGD
jgi:ribose transport system permease protein